MSGSMRAYDRAEYGSTGSLGRVRPLTVKKGMAGDDEVDGKVSARRLPDLPPDKGVDPTPHYYNMPPVTAANAPLKENIEASRSTKSRRRGGKRRDRGLYYRPLQYTIEEVPPWYLCILLGFQHYLIMFGATATNPLVLADAMCIPADDTYTKAELIGTIFVVSGICTILQCTIGVRLPLVQGGTFTFILPSVALLKLAKWKCPQVALDPSLLNGTNFTTAVNISSQMVINGTLLSPLSQSEPIWLSRIREIQGAIMVASLFQVLIGFSGIMGYMLKYIGPLSIAPTISLAGLALFPVAAKYSEKQWWITLVTVILIAAFSQYTKNIKIPCFRFERGRGCKAEPFPIFRLFPVILAIGITWVICAILTAANVFPTDPKGWGYGAGTNIRLQVLEEADWFRVPYPGQWGLPTVSAAGVFGMLAGVLTSMVESVGDYYACARMARVPPPPIHAVNRGIGVEGICCVIAGAFGSGTATTTYSENIGAIGITKVGSRRVLQCAGLIMIVFGIFSKFGSIFVTIPEPIVGGVFIVMFGMIVAVGISNLQFVDLNSSRNLFIIGFSFFFGLTLPAYVERTPTAIRTGSTEIDQILTVLMRTSMFVGGLAGFILDNTIPGTDEERGLIKWRKQTENLSGSEGDVSGTPSDNLQCYEIPAWTRRLEQYSWTRYMPFLPTFDEHLLTRCFKRRKRRKRVITRPLQEDNATDV